MLHHSGQYSLQHQFSAVLLIDLDSFHLVNDSFGYAMGDRVLRVVGHRLDCVTYMSHRLVSSWNASPYKIAHFRGDKFVILLNSIADVTCAIQLASMLIEALQQPFYLDNYELYIGASIGISVSSYYAKCNLSEGINLQHDSFSYRSSHRSPYPEGFSARFSNLTNPHDSFNQPINQSSNQPINQPINQPSNQSPNQPLVDLVTPPQSIVWNEELNENMNHPENSEIWSKEEKWDTLIRDAEIAVSRAKANGKACYEIYNAEMRHAAIERLQLETDLRRAIEREEFVIHYQPVIDIATGDVVGFEALVRWQHPTRGLMAPGQFLPLAEETGLIVPIDWWVLQQACQQMRIWQEEFVVHQPLTMSVNFSSRQFAQIDLFQRIEQILQETGLNPAQLKLEITETTIMQPSELTKTRLKRLRAQGVQLSLDDFGTGYSSLSYLHQFPINTLKIDRSFVVGLGQDSGSTSIIETIMLLAQKLSVEVIVEGVETPEQLAHLQAIGCRYIQGHLFSHALSTPDATQLLTTGAASFAISFENERRS